MTLLAILYCLFRFYFRFIHFIIISLFVAVGHILTTNAEQDFLAYLQQEAANQVKYIQDEIQLGRLASDEDLNMSNYFYDLPTTPKRRNKYLFPDSDKAPLRVHSLDKLFGDVGLEYPSKELVYPGKNFRLLQDLSSCRVLIGMTEEEEDSEPLKVTVWVVGDMDDDSSMDLATEAIQALVRP